MIAILTQPYNTETDPEKDPIKKDYIMAAYVKFVEQAGGIPIPLHLSAMTDDQIRDFVRRTNGMLIPGGGEDLTHKNGSWTEFTRRIDIAYQESKILND